MNTSARHTSPVYTHHELSGFAQISPPQTPLSLSEAAILLTRAGARLSETRARPNQQPEGGRHTEYFSPQEVLQGHVLAAHPEGLGGTRRAAFGPVSSSTAPGTSSSKAQRTVAPTARQFRRPRTTRTTASSLTTPRGGFCFAAYRGQFQRTTGFKTQSQHFSDRLVPDAYRGQMPPKEGGGRLLRHGRRAVNRGSPVISSSDQKSKPRSFTRIETLPAHPDVDPARAMLRSGNEAGVGTVPHSFLVST